MQFWNKRTRTFGYSYQKRRPYQLGYIPKLFLQQIKSKERMGFEPTVYQ